MRLSHYNVMIPRPGVGKDSYLLFNLLNRCVFEVDRELRIAIQERSLGDLDDSILRLLESKGVLIQDDVDELRQFKVLYNSAKYDYRGPLVVTLLPTYRCNMSCEYCYLGRGDELTDTIDDEVFRAAVELIERKIGIAAEPKIIANFYGGEPMLEVGRMFAFLEHFAPYIAGALISTNGTLMSTDIIRRLKGHPVAFQVTLAGTAETHDRKRMYKNAGGTFADIIRGIHMAVEESFPTDVRIDIDVENMVCISDLLDELDREGLKGKVSVGFNPIFSSYYATEYPHSISDPMVLPQLWEIADRKGFRLSLGSSSPPYAYCLQQTNRSLIIDPRGDLYPCTGYLGDRRFRIGNVSSGGLRAEHPLYTRWLARDPLEDARCRDCTALPLCCGGCAMKAHRQSGDFQAGSCGGFDDKGFLESYLQYLVKHGRFV